MGIGDLLTTINNNRDTKDQVTALEAEKVGLTYLRNIVMHTSRLTEYGRMRLSGQITSVTGKLESILANYLLISPAEDQTPGT